MVKVVLPSGLIYHKPPYTDAEVAEMYRRLSNIVSFTRPGGRITMIHRAAALGDLLELLGPRTGEIEILPVRPAPGAVAGRVLVRARKGLRRGPVTLYDGLTLHDVAGGPGTSRAAEALRGGALEWK